MQKIGDIPNTRADSNGEFTDGNVAGGVPPTILPAEWFNTIQRELMSILAAAETEADSDAFDQVLLSIQKLVSEGIPDLKDASLTQKGIVQLSSSITSTSEVLAATPKAVRAVDVASLKIANNLSEIKDAGLVAVAQTLLNLGLGEGSALPVGVPVPWPSATPPTGWLKCNGAAFTTSQYPKLALAYPALRLPDLRGEFIRGWDDGRGVDSGRILLGAQGDAIRNITGFVSGAGLVFDGFSGAFYDPGSRDAHTPASVNKVNYSDDFSFDASRVVPTANENRPRNIAFNYIVRAA